MEAKYKGKTIVYDIDTNTYNDGFSTTFVQDLLIAERFGTNAIKDTYNRVVKEWLYDVRYFTDFVIALNHRLWATYESNNMTYAKLYNDLWAKSVDLAFDTFTGEELQYYIGITD